MASFSQFLASLDADAGKRGKQFEHFVKWFLKNDPQWSTQVSEVWLWEEWPDRWGPDCGIDLIFKHKDGQTWAVQSKCYDAKYNITKHDVDKFLSESNRAGIDKRLLIATTDGLGQNAKQVCDAQDKEVVRFLLSNFEDADIDYPSSLEGLNKAKPKPKHPRRPYQIDAIEAVKAGFASADRGQLIMACGTGKTYTTLWIKEELNAQSTLVLLPSLGLLSQTLHEWTAARNSDFAVLCVCSDDSVGKRGSDEAVHDIADLAFPVTSDPVEIAKFLSTAEPKVVFSTYQSSNLIADAHADQKVPSFNLAIADEAHRCAGDKAGNFATILDGQRIRADKRLFTTATPRTYSTGLKKGAEGRGIEIVGMDNEEVFGKQFYTLNFGQAIKDGWLTDYRVVIVGVDSPMIASYIENREFVKTETGLEKDAETLAAQVALLKAMRDFDLHRMISFHSKVKRADEFASDLMEVAQWVKEEHRPNGQLRADFVSGEMPTFVRRQKLAMLKNAKENERALLTNARCLSEGVDVPSLDGVAFIDPKGSQVDIIQAVGRAIRLSPNKQAGTIVLPVFIGHGDNPEQALDEGNFKPIWNVLNALKSHDDVLADELDQMRNGMGKRGSSKVQGGFSKIEIDLPASVDKSFSDAIQTRLVENTTASWEFYYGLLEEYVKAHGNAFIPKEMEVEDQFKLGSWMARQRLAYSKNQLSENRIKRLESVSGWSWNFREDKWLNAFALLREYSLKNMTCAIDQKIKTPNGFRLGSWVVAQRMNRAELSKDKQELLESLVGWSWDPFEEKWNEAFAKLKAYVAKNGSALFPANTETEDGFRVGGWITVQRVNRQSLSDERKAMLESLNEWSWDPIGDQWEIGFAALKEYSEKNGNCSVPKTIKLSNGNQLWLWKANQRHRRDRLTDEQKLRLESLAGWAWDPHIETWEAGFRELLDYVSQNRSSVVPYSHKSPTGFKLGTWVYNQQKRKSVFNEDRITRLEALPDWHWNDKK